jgi:arylsulfatase A-like enzyme
MFAILAENLFIVLAHRGELAGAWEAREVRRWASPIAVAALMPLAFALVSSVRASARCGRLYPAVPAAGVGAVVAWGVSNGRHFASLLLRLPFVVGVAVAAAAIAWFGGPAVSRAAALRPRALALAGLVASVAAWCADAFVLPRLYPAFHLALLALTLALSALLALALRPPAGDRTRIPATVAALALACGVLSMGWAPKSARLLASADNVRMVLIEHAPLLGRAVWLASRLAPPPPLDDGAVGPVPTSSPQTPRTLDWTGHDIVLITVDALRADHVGAYGYPRPTTPSLDRLASDGARFDAAYCPTPHTSYSIASLMTGKYMRPLIAMGLGADSDTWAGLLRRYGYRTAAFYPPAVFFIDGDHFEAMRARGLDFEYRKEEFATPELRTRQVSEYLATAPRDKPMFLWVHFFEPHEPYVAHPEHPFGTSDIDRYDSEIATADDAIGAIVREVQSARPGAIVIATADHGEEFGEHGGRYHGTTVFEEQVRVPLLVDGPGVARGTVMAPTQTIDLLPTVLSALGIPRPARLRGRDLGPELAGLSGRGAEPGVAFAETDEYTLLARGNSRLICERRVGACALYDRARDPGETHDTSSDSPVELRDLKRAMGTVASEHGRFERGEEAAWPAALRRGIEGDADAAEDVAELLDDVSAAVRVKAAQVSFDLHAPATAPAMRRAVADTTADEAVRRWCALALVRMGEGPTPAAEALLRDTDAMWRRAAALAFAERGDKRGALELAEWWGGGDRAGLSHVRATEILAALGKIRDRAAAPALVASLDDVRLRPFVADALGAIGESAAVEPLAATLASETQVTSMAHEARALVALGGAPWTSTSPSGHMDARIAVPRGATRLRLVVLGASPSACAASVDGTTLASTDVCEAHAFDFDAPSRTRVRVTVDGSPTIAVFLLRAP